LKQYRNELAEEEARWERMVNDYEAAERAMDREYGVCHVY
jgi:hypothetical protein